MSFGESTGSGDEVAGARQEQEVKEREREGRENPELGVGSGLRLAPLTLELDASVTIPPPSRRGSRPFAQTSPVPRGTPETRRRSG